MTLGKSAASKSVWPSLKFLSVLFSFLAIAFKKIINLFIFGCTGSQCRGTALPSRKLVMTRRMSLSALGSPHHRHTIWFLKTQLRNLEVEEEWPGRLGQYIEGGGVGVQAEVGTKVNS